MADLKGDLQRASELGREAQRRLSHRLAALTDDNARSASRLPGWSVGHVLPYLA